MKSYHANSVGGLASLVAKDHPIPEPGPREVLVRVHANSLNARELSVLKGTYPLPVKPDVVMCADGAGEIVKIGTGVTRVKVGDRVAAAMFPRWIDGPISWEYAPQIGVGEGYRSRVRHARSGRAPESPRLSIHRARNTG